MRPVCCDQPEIQSPRATTPRVDLPANNAAPASESRLSRNGARPADVPSPLVSDYSKTILREIPEAGIEEVGLQAISRDPAFSLEVEQPKRCSHLYV